MMSFQVAMRGAGEAQWENLAISLFNIKDFVSSLTVRLCEDEGISLAVKGKSWLWLLRGNRGRQSCNKRFFFSNLRRYGVFMKQKENGEYFKNQDVAPYF